MGKIKVTEAGLFFAPHIDSGVSGQAFSGPTAAGIPLAVRQVNDHFLPYLL